MLNACGICGEEEETEEHIFLQCRKSVNVWKLSSLRLNSDQWKEWRLQNVVGEIIEKYPKDYTQLFAFVVWEIWKARNKWIFEKDEFNEWDIASKAQRAWGHYLGALERNTTKQNSKSERKGVWRAPHQGKLKLNCDMAVRDEGTIAAGFIVRNHEGKAMLAGKKTMKGKGDTTLLEGQAMLFALNKAREYGLRLNMVECDNMNLINMLNGTMSPTPYCDTAIEEILDIAKEMECENFEFIHREANEVAHWIAREDDFITTNELPCKVSAYVVKESLLNLS